MTVIENAGVIPNKARVDSAGRIASFATSITAAQSAVVRSDSFNLNSGIVVLTDSSEQGILYIKNNESRDLVISTILVSLGPSTNGDINDTTIIRLYKNPTTGTLITNAIAAEINSNSNFGSKLLLKIDEFKGDGSSTVDDGTVHTEVLVSPGKNAPFDIDEILTNGETMAITYEANDSNTNMKALASVKTFLSDPLSDG